MTIEEFYDRARQEAVTNNWRIGQALFNVLSIVRPDISEQMRGQPFDPFYSSSVRDPRYIAAVDFINNEWKDYT